MSQWVSVEGGIGGGKTTFLECVIPHLFKEWDYTLIPEPVEEWEESGILKRSYEDDNFKFAAQCVFFTSRIRKFRQLYNPSSPLHISERSPFSDKLFWNVNCNDPELHKAYMDMWVEWQNLLPIRKPTLFVYLNTSVDTCMRRMQERNREAESSVTREYQERIVAEHDAIFMDTVEMPDGTHVPCMVVDSEANYRDDVKVAKKIAKELSKRL